MALTQVGFGLNASLVQGTAQNSTSGTSIDFTGIPAGVKRVTVMFSGVSTTGTSPIQIQLGISGGVETTGYVSSSSFTYTTVISSTSTTGLMIEPAGAMTAAYTRYGLMIITSVGSNAWVSSASLGGSGATYATYGGGGKTLAGTLDRVRITTANGTDTFDAGSINILYE